MNLVHVAAALMTISNPGAGETVLLDFGADWCGYCREMDPIVDQLSREGYPVRKVNVDNNRALAARFSVESLPCFVLLVDGQEVDRSFGKVDRRSLEAMFRRNGVTPQSRSTRAQSPEPHADTARPVPFPASERPMRDRLSASDNFAAATSAGANPANAAPPSAAGYEPPAGAVNHDRLIRASVRLKIQDTQGNSTGSGTIIDAREGEALIVTCGHVFRDAAKDGQILVDLFGPQAPRSIPGRLIAYDIKSEVGIISIETDYPVAVARLAPPELKLKPGDRVISVGCDGGADASARETKVTSLDRYLGAPNLQVDFQPVQGRSGGGLFTPDGWMVGICYAADPESKEGLFAALPAIRDQLDRAGLTFVYRQVDEGPQPANLARANTNGDEPQLEARSPAQPLGGANEPGLSADEQAALRMLKEKAQNAEVVCIVRPLGNPDAKSEIIVLDRVSPAFVDQLKSRRATQHEPQLTSLETPAPRTDRARTPAPSHSGAGESANRKQIELSPWWADAARN